MKNCKNGLCKELLGEECNLEQYLKYRGAKNLEKKADAAEALENLGPGCPQKQHIETTYASALADSIRALQELRLRARNE